MPARILVVDDMVVSVKMLSAKLTGEYYDVLTATDGPSALEIIARDEPDLVLLDVMMPGMDGYEVCRRIKQNPATTHLPVVMITALSDVEERVRGLDAGADDFLTKPVNDLTLFSRVRSMVRLKRTLDQWRLREATTHKLGLIAVSETVVEVGSHGRVAIVDEGPVECAWIKTVLDGDQAHIMAFETLRPPVDKIVAMDPDVMVIGLPNEGDDALRLVSLFRATEQTRHLPILLIGGEEDSSSLVKSLDVGANDYVLRPIDPGELKARVRTQVRRKRYHDRLRANFLRNLSLALTDSLTNLYNRRYFTSHIEATMARIADTGEPVSLLMIDIDHFKKINDTYGHTVGDDILREISERILRNVRGVDLAARYGGEEFAVVMPDTTLEVAMSVAERLCEKTAEQTVRTGGDAGEVKVTLSIGAAESTGPGDTPKGLIERADKALYRAKDLGRNRVVAAPRAADPVK